MATRVLPVPSLRDRSRDMVRRLKEGRPGGNGGTRQLLRNPLKGRTSTSLGGTLGEFAKASNNTLLVHFLRQTFLLETKVF